MQNPTEMVSWKKLTGHARNFFKMHSSLSPKITYVTSEHISLDYHGQRINDSILNTLLELADEVNLSSHIKALLDGQPVNNTENQPALHTALRANHDEVIQINAHNIIQDVIQVRQTMNIISTQIRNGKWLGYSGKPITDVINIGIGGSMLGPLFCLDALGDYVTDKLKFHFISEIDPNIFSKVTAKLHPETTLFIVSSKSFTTAETLWHMEKAFAWINQKQHSAQHFIAVTANIKKAQEHGFHHILPIWNWVGGRYSSCSAINLITCIAIGFEQFSALLIGANSMDHHFKTKEWAKNLPVLLALFGIWNINFLNSNNILVLTYANDLKYFVPYLQQLDMESNGKSINKQGRWIDYNTGPIVWGGPGNQAQHSYYQLLCQGTHKIPTDLISIKAFDNKAINRMCRGHSKVLTQGINKDNDPHGYIPGEVPINHISLTACHPQALGALIALYEHKIFVQGVIWNINSFDQPGIESSKKIFKKFVSF